MAKMKAADLRYSIAGTWSNWTLEDMPWDGECFYYIVEVGRETGNEWEAFTIFQNGDWNRRFHPSVKDANPEKTYELRGPGPEGDGYDWLIGHNRGKNVFAKLGDFHGRMAGASLVGTKYKIKLFIDSKGRADRLTWDVSSSPSCPDFSTSRHVDGDMEYYLEASNDGLEWMWTDVKVAPLPGMGWLAKRNPLRWSRAQPLFLADELENQAECRPVTFRIAGRSLDYWHKSFDTPQAAAQWIADCEFAMKAQEYRRGLQHGVQWMYGDAGLLHKLARLDPLGVRWSQKCAPLDVAEQLQAPRTDTLRPIEMRIVGEEHGRLFVTAPVAVQWILDCEHAFKQCSIQGWFAEAVHRGITCLLYTKGEHLSGPPLEIADKLSALKGDPVPVQLNIVGGRAHEYRFDTPAEAVDWILSRWDEWQKEAQARYPGYWSNNDNRMRFKDAILLDAKDNITFQILLDKSYSDICTRDRPCPARPPCKNSKAVAGGCECARKGGQPGLPLGYRVCKVFRVEDSDCWNNYMERRRSIKEQRRQDSAMQRHTAHTSGVVDAAPGVFASVDPDVNEMVLFHGTNTRVCLKIAAEDVRLNLSKPGGGLGPGVYCTESITKADEYATDTTEPGGRDPDSYYQGIFAVLVMRVTMGNVHYRQQFFADSEKASFMAELLESQRYDSTLADRLKSAGTYREFCVYDKEQVYTEYVVFYERRYSDPVFGLGRFRSSHESERPEMFNFQVPSYWNNFHKNPDTESFDDCIALRPRGFALLQHSIRVMTGNTSLQLLEASRLEHSEMLRKYCEIKMTFQNRGPLPSQGLAKRLAMSDAQKKDISAAAAQHAFSWENMEDCINEFFCFAPIAPADDAFPDIRQAAMQVRDHGEVFKSPADALRNAARHSSSCFALFVCRVLLGQITSEGAEPGDSIMVMSEGVMKFKVYSGAQQIYPEMMAIVYDPCDDVTPSWEGDAGYPARA